MPDTRKEQDNAWRLWHLLNELNRLSVRDCYPFDNASTPLSTGLRAGRFLRRPVVSQFTLSLPKGTMFRTCHQCVRILAGLWRLC